METELLTLYNVMNSYKSSLMTILNKIDQRMLQALNTHTKLSITKKYKLPLEILEIIRNYVQMLYTVVNVAEELFSKLSELERDTHPEKDSTESNEHQNFEIRLFQNEFTPDNTTESETETVVDYLTDVKNEENSETEDCQSVNVSRESSPTLKINKYETKIENQVEIIAVKEENTSIFTPEGIQLETAAIDLNSHTSRLDNGELSTNASRHIEKKTKEKSATYDILEDDLRLGEECVFCHIITPSEFYLRSNQELFECLETTLNEELNSRFQYVDNNYKTKEEALANLGNFCFGFIEPKLKWFRIEVLDWMLDAPERIFVQLIDYGDKCYSSYYTLKPMIDTYSMVPKMAIKCHLAEINSPDPQEIWSKDSIERFTKLSEIDKKTKFQAIYVYKENDSYAVDLLKINWSDGTPIGVSLERSGYASQFNISGDCLSASEEDEFDNINEAIAGYDAQDEARICRFTDITGTKCFKGAMCKKEHGHLSADGITTDKILTLIQPLEELSLPSVNTYIRIFVTGYINLCHFYVHIITNPPEDGYYNQEFMNLQIAMKSNSIVQTYQPFKVCPAIAELVLVKEGPEWFRGKCRGYSKNGSIEIFLVDFGSTTIKKLKYLRQMKEDFLYVPFQAVECVMSDCQEKGDASLENSFQFFQNRMRSHEFKALVKDNSIPLKLKVWDMDGNDMTDVIIKEYALGQERTDDCFPAIIWD